MAAIPHESVTIGKIRRHTIGKHRQDTPVPHCQNPYLDWAFPPNLNDQAACYCPCQQYAGQDPPSVFNRSYACRADRLDASWPGIFDQILYAVPGIATTPAGSPPRTAQTVVFPFSNRSQPQRLDYIVINADGAIRYEPKLAWFGDDSFTYTISDGRGGTDTATVRIVVGSTAP